MKYLFQVCGSPSLGDIDTPIVLIDGRRIDVASFYLSYEADNDKYVVVITGFLPDSPDLQKFKINPKTKECTLI